jgi:hypothetical protein
MRAPFHTRQSGVIPMAENPTISLAANGKLLLLIPSSGNDKFSLKLFHSVEIPNNELGLRLLNYVLTARNSGKTKLGQDGNPTQEMIKLWLNNKFEQDRLTAREEMLNDF